MDFNEFELSLMNFNYFCVENMFWPGRIRISAGRGSQIGALGAGEGQGGPNESQLETKIGQNLQSKKIHISKIHGCRSLDSYMAHRGGTYQAGYSWKHQAAGKC